jgi:hypothetical protein
VLLREEVELETWMLCDVVLCLCVYVRALVRSKLVARTVCEEQTVVRVRLSIGNVNRQFSTKYESDSQIYHLITPFQSSVLHIQIC